MAVIDLVKWNGHPSILAWKFPGSDELSTWTQLIVNETQEAYLVKEGVYQGPFGAGRHTLSTENIPLLTALIGLPFGGKSPFTAEVWYVNRATNLDIRWGTPDAIQLQDPKYQVMVPVRAFGQYGVRIKDAKKFLLKLVGTLPGFDVETLSNYFKGVFTTKIKTNIATAIIKNGTSVLDIATQLEALSDMLKASLAPEMDEYGLELVQFNIHSINLPEDDPAVQTLKAALAKKMEMGLLGYNYQQERSFDVMAAAAGNEGTAGGVMGAGLGMGMGMGMGVPMGAAFGQLAPNLQVPGSAPPSPGTAGAPAAPSSISCDKCGSAIPKGSRFCPNCADPVNACSACGEDNVSGAANCRGCGKSMPMNCRSCSAVLPQEAKFCLECGTKTSLSCAKCGADVLPGSKFCGSCGEPQAGS